MSDHDHERRVKAARDLPMPWCGDNSCMFGVPTGAGMATNGGCRCLPERSLLKNTEETQRMVALVKTVPDLLDAYDSVIAQRDEERERAEASRDLLIHESHGPLGRKDAPYCWRVNGAGVRVPAPSPGGTAPCPICTRILGKERGGE